MVNSQTFNWNIFMLEEGALESRVPGRKQPIFAARRIQDSTRDPQHSAEFKLDDSL